MKERYGLIVALDDWNKGKFLLDWYGVFNINWGIDNHTNIISRLRVKVGDYSYIMIDMRGNYSIILEIKGLTMKDKIIILLPVKGNSKRLKNKNLKLLNEEPLFTYACGQVWDIADKLVFDAYISSESKEVEKIWTNSGWMQIFEFLKRPKELSEDPNQIEEVCLYVLNQLKTNYDTLIMIQPSNPFVQSEDIENCYKMFTENNRSTVRSIYKTSKSFFKSFVMHGNKLTSPAFNQLKKIQTCNYPDSYLGNGSLIVIDVKKFKKEKTFLTECSIGYEMPRERSIDIDDSMDFFIAEQLMKKGE